MAKLVHTSRSFGSADRPLRKYIALANALERVLHSGTHSGIDGQPLREQLVHTWAHYVHNALHLRGIAVAYAEHEKRLTTPNVGSPDEALWEAVRSAEGAAEGAAFADVADRLYIRRSIQQVSARLIVGLLHTKDWDVKEIGWVADTLDLLDGVIARARRRELDRIAQRVTHRQTMLKELRPNSLYYNLLHSIEHVVRHDYRSTLIACGSEEATIVAETLHHSRPAKSTRIGSRLALSCRSVPTSVVASALATKDAAAEMCRTLFGASWGSPIESALVLPLQAKYGDGDLVLVLTDSRQAFFSSADVEAVGHVAGRTTHIILNSVQFSSRLEERSRALDDLILQSSSREELLQRAVGWLCATFEATTASIVSGGARYTAGEPHASGSQLTEEILEHFARSERATFHRRGGPRSTDKTSGFEAVFAAPLRLLDGDRGAVACHYGKLRQPSQFEHFLFEGAVQQISSALTIRSVGDRQLGELRRVVGLMEKVASAVDDVELLESLTTEVKNLLGADYCFVSVPDSRDGVLRLRARTWGEEFDVPPIDITALEGEGITGYVAVRRTVYRTGDVGSDPYYRSIVARSAHVEIRSEMAGPLVFQDRLLGVIDLLSSRRDAFSEQGETLLRMLLAHSSIALAQAQRARAGRERAAVIEGLHDRLVNLTNPDEIYAVIIDTALEYVRSLHPGHEIFGNLYVKSPNVRFLEAKAFKGPKGEKYSPTQYFNEGVVGMVASTGETAIIDDTSSPPPGIVYEPFFQGIVHGSEIAVAIRVGENVDAVINLESPEPALFGVRDRIALEALAHEISLAVRFAQLNDAARLHRRRQVADQQLRFLLNVSHEVAKSARVTSQTMPELELMMADHPDGLRLIAKAREHAERALSTERRLLRSLAQGETADVINCLANALEVMAHYPDVEVVREVSTATFRIEGSGDLVTFVFSNLFDNAVHAMKGNGRLTISEHVVDDPSTLVLDITDDGIGIAPEKHERIFEPLYSDDGTGKPKGMGVGMLLIVENLERVQGSIKLHHSEPGAGSTFRLTFTRGLA